MTTTNKRSSTFTDHPLASQLSKIKSSDVIDAMREDIESDQSKSKSKSYSKSRSKSKSISKRKMNEALHAQMRKNYTSVEIAEFVDDVHDEQREKKFIDKMQHFLQNKMKDNNERRYRGSSFWSFGDSNNGQVIDLNRQTSTFSEVVKTNTKDPDRLISIKDAERMLFIRPWVFNAEHIYRQAWDIIFVMLSLLYTVVRVPYAIAFDIDEFDKIDAWFIFNRLVDLIFISDMVIIFMTARKDGRKLIISHYKIAMAYFKGWFLFDLVASVPLDLIMWLGTGAELGGSDDTSSQLSRSGKLIRVIKIFRTFRILRLLRLKRMLVTLENFFGVNFSVMAITKYFIAIVLLAHLLACGFLGVSSNGWLVDVVSRGMVAGGEQSSEYLASLYWAFTTMTTIGYGDIVALTANERIFSTLSMIVGAVTFTYGVTRIVHIFGAMGKSQKNLTSQMENINEWAKMNEFPDEMVSDIRTYLHYKHSRSYFDEKAVISGLSIALQRKILKHMYEVAMKKVELFKHCSDDFLTELMLRMRTEFAHPYSIIISQGSIGDCMYIIRRGCCAVYRGFTKRNVKSAVILSQGQAFGEIALLADNITRTANIVALEWTDLAVITRKDFEQLISFFPREQFKMHKYAETKIKNWKLIRAREKIKKRENRKKKEFLKEQKKKTEGKNEIQPQSKKKNENERQRAQSANSGLSQSLFSQNSHPSDSPNTKSISEDIQRYRHSVKNNLNMAGIEDKMLDAVQYDDLRIMDDTTHGQSARVPNKTLAKLQADDDNGHQTSVDKKMPITDLGDDQEDEKFDGDRFTGLENQDLISRFPGDVILRRLSVLSKQLNMLQESWSKHLIKNEKLQNDIQARMDQKRKKFDAQKVKEFDGINIKKYKDNNKDDEKYQDSTTSEENPKWHSLENVFKASDNDGVMINDNDIRMEPVDIKKDIIIVNKGDEITKEDANVDIEELMDAEHVESIDTDEINTNV